MIETYTLIEPIEHDGKVIETLELKPIIAGYVRKLSKLKIDQQEYSLKMIELITGKTEAFVDLIGLKDLKRLTEKLEEDYSEKKPLPTSGNA